MNQLHKDLVSVVSMLLTLQSERDFELPTYKAGGEDLTFQPLKVKHEYLKEMDMDIFTYMQTMKILRERGYIYHIGFFDKEKMILISEYSIKNPQQIKDILYKGRDLLLKASDEQIKDTLPQQYKGTEFYNLSDKEMAANEEDTIKFNAELDTNIVSYLWILPFRKLDNFLNKIRRGKDIEDIEDEGIGYLSDQKLFFINEFRLNVQAKNEPPIIHYILTYMFKNGIESKHYFAEMNEQTITGQKKTLRSYIDACINFQKRITKRNEAYQDLFTITSTDVHINPKYLN